MTKHTPIEYRKVQIPQPEQPGGYDVTEYIVSRSQVIGTTFVTYEAWHIANGRTFDFSTICYVDNTTVQAWLGRVGTEIDREILAMPVGDERSAQVAYKREAAEVLARDLILTAFPEVQALLDDGKAKFRSCGVDVTL